MKQPTLIIILFSLIASCSNKDNELKKQILGEWKFEETIDLRKKQELKGLTPPPPIPTGYKLGYEFYDNDSCDYKGGFFKWHETKDFIERFYEFIGVKTSYKIEKETLKIYDRNKNKWANYHISDIKNDTLKVRIDDSTFQLFSKVYKKSKLKDKVDAIIVSSSGCYGSCPISDFYIKSDGYAIFNGKKYNSKNGYYLAKGTQTDFENILSLFERCQIDSMQNEYQATHTDDECVSVTFIKDNKIVKTVSDYGHVSQTEFIWAYTQSRFYYQKLNLVSAKNIDTILPKEIYGFQTVNQVIRLEDSERFYLGLEFAKAQKVPSIKKNLTFQAKGWNGEGYDKIETDGKLIKYKGSTYDIGYNFIEKNLKHKIKDKEIFD